MITHYLKVSFRNMWKYKNQTFVSIVGLAVGFVCFAMATLWIRYEMTYDSFHKNADRMYCINREDDYNGKVITSATPYPLGKYLKSTFPEIANATTVELRNIDFKYQEINHQAYILRIDSLFCGMFGIKIIEGSMADCLTPQSTKIAITREKALQLFGNESPVGKKIIKHDYRLVEYDICAVVTGLPEHSNYTFDFLGAFDFWTTVPEGWNMSFGQTLVELASGIDEEAFKKKLYEHEIQRVGAFVENMTLVPITSVRYKGHTAKREVQFKHIIIFALAGSLLILCTLFNYLTLFVSRFRMRQRELALRMVYGASVRSLFAMLSVEFLLSLTAALVLGLVLINIVTSPFRAVSGIKLELSTIYFESTVYIVVTIMIALAVFFLTLVIFRRRTLNASIRSNKKILRKISIVAQLTISIVFAFCTLVILKQMYYLHSTDLGFSFKNRGSINVEIAPEEIEILNDKIKQIPEIEETLTKHSPMLPIGVGSVDGISNWDGKQGDATINIRCTQISEQYAKFYELELIEGEFPRDDDDEKYVLINESAAKAFGWDKAVGKSFGYNNNNMVKGVIKNVYNFSPTFAAQPVYYLRPGSNRVPSSETYILFKYDEGSWKTSIERIQKIVEKEFPNRFVEYYSTEKEYDKYLKSENALLAILTVVSLICLLVCVFGFVSMVSLTCEERRKEIAIRKINGATIKDILDIFFKEYLTLLIIGTLIAFPVGYIIMKRWLEQYVIQTEMSAWIYLSILLALVMIVVICVGGRVYKTSRENPVNAITN
jgi:ABC-type antimicrobial peptide transport system permease subunit